MRSLLVLSCLALAGCVEVTRFKADTGDVYLADCENPVRLQSCQAAMAATCPQGYDVLAAVVREEHDEKIVTKSGYFKCR
ncbi:MAG TPA: hypothetical protein VL974_01045 [Magnetospirillum sp.]|nr:hypothetical protein [Magnetospirillum sp.]